MISSTIYLITGTTEIAQIPTSPVHLTTHRGSIPPATNTPLLKDGRLLFDGPFPCFDQFPSLANLLDKANVAWRFYYDVKPLVFPFNPYSAMKYVALGPDWKNDMSVPATNVLSDLAHGSLKPVFVGALADAGFDFPGNGDGPKWVSSIVQAAQKSAYWKHVAIVVIWNDSGDGNFYDNVAAAARPNGSRLPRADDRRLPVCQARLRLAHAVRIAAFLEFIEENWNLGQLGLNRPAR